MTSITATKIEAKPIQQGQVLLTRQRRQQLKRVIQYGVLLVWSLFMLFPIYWTFASSLKTPVDVFAKPPKWFFWPTLHNYEVVLGLTIPTELEGMTKEATGAGQSQFPRFLKLFSRSNK